MKIQSALISVFSKEGIEPIAKELVKNDVKIYSTGGTQKYLEDLGIKVYPVDEQTNYPAVFGGRVKTLHPAIFGGILYRRDNENDLKELKEHNIPSIDLVIVDLYPFEDTVASGAEHQAIIEKIDIGGISLIRATAKNYKDTVIVPSVNQYETFLDHYKANNGSTTTEFRKELAYNAFEITRDYDTAISGYFGGEEVKELRYGENPHQKAEYVGNLSKVFKQLNGKELSYNNLLDIDAAVALMQDISRPDLTSFAVLKHNNACGCAQRGDTVTAFKDALAGDPVSAFGGILICDREIDLATANEIDKLFYEVCIAPSFSSEAQEKLSAKAKRVLLQWDNHAFSGRMERTILNGKLVQDRDSLVSSVNDLSYPTDKRPTEKEVEDLLFAERLVKNTKSNAIILVKDLQLMASGTGQTSRVDALRQAINKAKSFSFELAGGVLASDAFFPFPDCIEISSEENIAAVIQPGGSIKDNLSINAANERGMSMVFTGKRHFKH
jgi:phosphoribosylaminoimidazolecarboxamide formyltransferase/IMP cyclohydrolase